MNSPKNKKTNEKKKEKSARLELNAFNLRLRSEIRSDIQQKNSVLLESFSHVSGSDPMMKISRKDLAIAAMKPRIETKLAQKWFLTNLSDFQRYHNDYMMYGLGDGINRNWIVGSKSRCCAIRDLRIGTKKASVGTVCSERIFLCFKNNNHTFDA